MAKQTQTMRDKLCEATLRCAANMAWHEITLNHIARTAKISAATAEKLFATTDDILPALVEYISAKTCAAVGKVDQTAAAPDRLFEVMMARIDILQSHRTAILSIMRSCTSNPRLGTLMLKAHCSAMQQMLKVAKLNHGGWQEQIQIVGLLGIYQLTLRQWTKDDTKDLTKTMASLDRSLKKIDVAAVFITKLIERSTA